MFRNNPKARLVLYTVALIALGIVSALNVLHIIDPAVAGQISNTINTLATILGVGAAGTAAITLGRQQVDGTLAVSGTPAEQLSQAAQNYAQQTAQARDSVAQAQAVLNAELQKAQKQQTDLLREWNNGEPERRADEFRQPQKYQDRVAQLRGAIQRVEADVAGLQRELSRLPSQQVAQP